MAARALLPRWTQGFWQYSGLSRLASPLSLTRTEFLIRCVYWDTRNNLTFHLTSHRSPWITSKQEVIQLG